MYSWIYYFFQTLLLFDVVCRHEGMGATDDQNLQIIAHRGKLMPMNSAIILSRVTLLRKIDHILYFMKDQFLTEQTLRKRIGVERV